MHYQTNIIKKINDLAMQYSRGFITFDNYKTQRSELLSQLESGDNQDDKESILTQSGILDVVNTVAGIIKRS